jgi:MoaA/NifB/PqqE/SkfB family radical SAM enzyme
MNSGARTVYLHLTRACNLRCRYCYFDAGAAMPREMSLSELEPLFADVAALEPKKLVFTGGEPLLRTDLFEVASAFREADTARAVRLCLVSNGLLVDEDMAARLVACFDEVRVSVDGPEDINDRLRGPGSFRAARRAIQRLRDAGLGPGVSVTVTALNLRHLAGFLSFLLDEEGVTGFHLAPFRPFGRGCGHPELQVSWREAQEAAATFWRTRFGEPTDLASGADCALPECGNCGVGSYINIHPDGTVYPCHVLSVPKFCLGNVNRDRLTNIIRDSPILEWLRGLDHREFPAVESARERLPGEPMCLGDVLCLLPEYRELAPT